MNEGKKMWKSLIVSVLIACAPGLVTAASADHSSKKTSIKKKQAVKKKVSKRTGLQHASLSLDQVNGLALRSNSVLVYDQNTGESVYQKNTNIVQPIASITKLMTALVVLENKLDLDEPVTVDERDIDTLKHTRSRLNVGTVIRRGDLIRLALMASENRAAAALARSAPGGTPAFVAQMNKVAATLGLTQTHFADSSGLSSQNVSSPTDLAKLVEAAYQHPLIREYSTTPGLMLTMPDSGRSVVFNNTNSLVRSSDWHIGVQKTGFINEAGQCLVMQTTINDRPFIIVLLDSVGKYSRIADAIRIKRWLEHRAVTHVANGAI
jgi:D-alanyl-D-alanine endopeptidase (penicillin-binding protein 7)